MLTLLAERRAGVACRIYGKNVNKRDIQLAFSRFQQQYPNDQLQLTQWNATHDLYTAAFLTARNAAEFTATNWIRFLESAAIIDRPDGTRRYAYIQLAH